MKRFDNFLYGLVPGLLLPIAFMWVYLNQLYPGDFTFFESLKQLYPGEVFGKLLMLSIMPNLVLVYVFYKSDSFKIASGMLIGGMPYFITSIFMF